MRKLEKIDFKRLKGEILAKPSLKFIVGGYELPEVTISCGQNSGDCWECLYVHSGSFSGYCRQFTGRMDDYCSAAQKCKDL